MSDHILTPETKARIKDLAATSWENPHLAEESFEAFIKALSQVIPAALAKPENLKRTKPKTDHVLNIDDLRREALLEAIESFQHLCAEFIYLQELLAPFKEQAQQKLAQDVVKNLAGLHMGLLEKLTEPAPEEDLRADLQESLNKLRQQLIALIKSRGGETVSTDIILLLPPPLRGDKPNNGDDNVVDAEWPEMPREVSFEKSTGKEPTAEPEKDDALNLLHKLAKLPRGIKGTTRQQVAVGYLPVLPQGVRRIVYQPPVFPPVRWRVKSERDPAKQQTLT